MKRLSPFSRRDMLRAGGAAAVMAAGGVLVPAAGVLSPAWGKAPMSDTQVPGFFPLSCRRL